MEAKFKLGDLVMVSYPTPETKEVLGICIGREQVYYLVEHERGWVLSKNSFGGITPPPTLATDKVNDSNWGNTYLWISESFLKLKLKNIEEIVTDELTLINKEIYG